MSILGDYKLCPGFLRKGIKFYAIFIFIQIRLNYQMLRFPFFPRGPKKGNFLSIFSKIIPWMKTEQPIDEINAF